MRKILLILGITITTICSTLGVSANCGNTCKIQDSPAPVLEQYIDNLSKIVRNVSSGISSADTVSTTTEKTKSSILASMSQIINFSGYYSSFDFYVALPITQEVPAPVKRDHQRLIRENERLSRLLKSITRKGYGEISITEACDGVSESCELSGLSARAVLTKLIKNNKNITDFYRLSLLDRNYIASQEFILVPQNFDTEIQSHYNKSTLTDCSRCDGGFMDRMNKSIDKISNLNNDGSEGIRKWKDAWALLTGASGQSSKTKAEDKLLSDKLAQDGISGDAATAVTDNLQRYNSGGLSTSNPFFNSANYTFSNAKREVDSFKEGITQHLDTEQETIPIVFINDVTTEVQKTQDIRNDIEEIYKKQYDFLPTQDTPVSKLVAKVIRMHYSLVESINILDPAIKDSQKVCNSQGAGQGNCDGYN